MSSTNIIQYDQTAINAVGNFAKDFFNNFNHYIQQEEYKNPSRLLFGKSFSMIKNKNALDNYILKYYSKLDDEDPEQLKIKKNMQKYLSAVYKSFMLNPTKLIDSPFLRSSRIVDMYCPSESLENNKKLIDEVKEKYIETTKNWKSLYIKDEKQDNLSEEETDILMYSLIKNIGTDDNEVEEYQKAYLKKLIAKGNQVNELSLKQVEFIAKYVNNWMINSNAQYIKSSIDDIKTKIYIGEDKKSLGGTRADYGIYINKNSNCTSSIPLLIQTICHETQHSMQAAEAKINPNSKIGIDYAVYDIIRNYYNSKNGYDVYNKNYRVEEIEKNAEEQGFKNASIFLNVLGFYDKSKELLQEKQKEFKSRKFEYDYRTFDDNKKGIRETFIFNILSEAVESSPKLLNQYPALLSLYTKDGKPKSFEKLVSQKFLANEESMSEIPEDFCKYYILVGALDKLNLNEFSEEAQVNIASRLTHILIGEGEQIDKMSRNSDVDDKLSDINKKGVERSHLKISKSIMEFINNNYEYLRNLQDKGKFSSLINIDYYDSSAYGFGYDTKYEGLVYNDDNDIKEIKRLALECKENKRKYFEQKNTTNISDMNLLQNKTGSSKLKFAKGLIQAYEDTEEKYQYEKRAEEEFNNIKIVKDIIRTEGKNIILIGELQGDLIKKSGNDELKISYSQKQISEMARLLKVANLLTESKKLNPEGINYLEEFLNIPNIEIKLKQMSQGFEDENSYIYNLRQKSRENSKNGNKPSYPKTKAEIAAIYGMTFKNEVTNSLESNDLFKNTRMENVKQLEEKIEKDRQRSEKVRKR